MEISTAMMQHILRLTEGYTDLLNELKEVKAELAELKGEKPKKPTIGMPVLAEVDEKHFVLHRIRRELSRLCSVFNIFQFKGRKITGVIQKTVFFF